jgi:hypothetical protein
VLHRHAKAELELANTNKTTIAERIGSLPNESLHEKVIFSFTTRQEGSFGDGFMFLECVFGATVARSRQCERDLKFSETSACNNR